MMVRDGIFRPGECNTPRAVEILSAGEAGAEGSLPHRPHTEGYMAVYTTLERHEIEDFLVRYGLGELVDYEGVASGIENTNYFVTIDRRDTADDNRTRHRAEFVLTLFEAQPADDLHFHVGLLRLLEGRGLPVPSPLRDVHGEALHSLLGRPTLLMPRIAGEHPLRPDPAQCEAIGAALAEIHRVARDAGLEHRSHRGLAWLRETAAGVRSHLDNGGQALLDRQLEELDRLENLPTPLPQGIIHGDLFRDNALFSGANLRGIIDFFSAGSGYLLLDLAIVANDWCYEPGSGLLPDRLDALLKGYASKRTPTDAEKRHWPQLLRLAALRFWISRLEARHAPQHTRRPGVLAALKDPDQYRAILASHVRHDPPWPDS